MSLLITIPIALILAIILRFRNVSLYKKNYTGINSLQIQSVHIHNTLNAAPNYKPLELSDKFFNFTANLILKFIIFTVLAVIKYIFRDLPVVGIIICTIYAIPTALSWFTYKRRRAYYKEIHNDYIKEAFLPILKASICVPVYQTVLNFFLIVI